MTDGSHDHSPTNMEEYLTVRGAIELTGKSEVTIRRHIRNLRAQYGIALDDTNEQLAEKTPLLRKQDEGEDKNGEPVFTWLIANVALKNLLDASQPSIGDDAQGVDDHPQEQADYLHEIEDLKAATTPEGGHDLIRIYGRDDRRARVDLRRDDEQWKDDDPHDNEHLREDGIHDDLREYTHTVEIPVATWKALNQQLDEKDIQIGKLQDESAKKEDRFREQQLLFARTQEAALRLPSGSFVRRVGDTEDATTETGNDSRSSN